MIAPARAGLARACGSWARSVWDPSKVVVVTDHYTPAVDLELAAIQKLTREWVKENKVGAFYDQQGICHIVLAEGGHLKPGMFCAGGDSHSTTGGAFGCYMAGFGATEMTGVMVTGEIWTRVPETVRVRLDRPACPRASWPRT